MKFLVWTLGFLIILSLGVLGLERAASERIEVVELHTLDESGENVTTRLWIVDDDGYPYLRVGSDGSGWYSRLQESEVFQLTRDGTTSTYTAVTRPEKSQHINNLMHEKYTWGDTVIGFLVGSREESLPIELQKQ